MFKNHMAPLSPYPIIRASPTGCSLFIFVQDKSCLKAEKVHRIISPAPCGMPLPIFHPPRNDSIIQHVIVTYVLYKGHGT